MESDLDFWTAKAALEWQIEMGVDEAICDAPLDRYALEDKKPAAKAAPKPPPAAVEPAKVDASAFARQAADAAQDLDGLRGAMAAFDHCAFKAAARNLVFDDGTRGAPVMIITDAPSRQDDRAGALFSGPSGRLLDKMLGAIGCARDTNVYAAPVVPWNPPQDRDLTGAELAMMLPFLQRHITLAAPKVLVLMGNGPCQALMGKSGVTRLRGTWTDVLDRPALPMIAPSYLLNTPAAKRDAWADLLSLKARLKDHS